MWAGVEEEAEEVVLSMERECARVGWLAQHGRDTGDAGAELTKTQMFSSSSQTSCW